MGLAHCVKIPPRIEDMRKNIMYHFEQIELYVVLGQPVAAHDPQKFYKRYKYRCKR